MSVCVISGSAGLIGSESARFFAELGFDIVGIDNDMRMYFFGTEASTIWNKKKLEKELRHKYIHYSIDIRNFNEVKKIFMKYKNNIRIVIHTAAQPSHDWAAREPFTDFSINATGTLNMLEATRNYCKYAVFIFTSSNKVYGDLPNKLPLRELESRWEIDPYHTFANGISEDMSIDQCVHSLFGASKLAADILVQEYGRYFKIPTVCFRGGCLTGSNHSGTELHGFLAYLVKCTAINKNYTVFGYKGKQVRDNIHSADLINAFYKFYKAPRIAEVYNIGGGLFSNCSMLEAIRACERICGKDLNWEYTDTSRIGDHIWWVSDLSKFMGHYPEWNVRYSIEDIIKEIYESNIERWSNAFD